MKLRKEKGRKVNLTNLTGLKIRGCLFIRGISLLLIPFFLFSNLTFAQTFQAENSTLARYSFMQFAKVEGEESDRLASKLAQAWVADIATKVKESEGKITLYDAVAELNKQIEKWAEEANMPIAKTARIIGAVITEAAKLLERPTVERDKLDLNMRAYVVANLKDLKTKLPKDVDTEKILDILTIFKQNQVTEGSILHLQMNLLRLGVPKNKLMYILNSITLGTIPADRGKEETIPTPQTVIPQVEYLTKHAIEAHKLLRPEGRIDLGKIAIVMQKDLTDGFSGEKKAVIGETLKQEYQRMKQDIRKHFPNSKEIEAKDKAELPNIVNSLIDQGLKVVMLDDGTLTKHLRSSDIKGKAAEDYCVIRAQHLKDIDTTTIQFLNLNAMALMGVAVLHNDLIFFKTAYRLFTGKEADIVAITGIENRTIWSFPALPRIIKFTGMPQDKKELQRLFSVSV